MENLNFEVGIVSSDLLKKIEQIRIGIKSVAFELEEQGRKVNSSFFSKVFNALDGTKMLKAFVGNVIETRKEMEQLDKTFEVLLGSKEKADSFSNEIKNYALNSTLSVTEISQAAQELLGFNVSAEEVIPVLEMLGDLSMGNSQKFSSLALTFGQISAEGKITNENLTQLANEGFNPLQTIADRTGMSMTELTNKMSEGKISIETVREALELATGEGGQFYGMMEKRAGGITGAQKKMEIAIQDTLNTIGEQNEDLIEGAYDVVTSLVENYETIGRVVISLIATYGAAKAALIVYDVIKAKDIALDYAKLVVTGKLDAAMKALNLTMLKNPYVLAAALIVGVAMAMWTLADHTTAAEKAQENYNNRIKEASEKEQERKDKLKGLVGELEDATTADARRMEILDIIKEEYPAFFKYMLDEQGHVSDLTEAWKAYNEEIVRNKAESSKQRAAELKRNIAEEKRFLEMHDMGFAERSKLTQSSESDKYIWNKYRSKGTYNIKKDIETNTFELIQVEKDIMDDSFNEWKAGLKQKNLQDINNLIAHLQSLLKTANGNKYQIDAYNKRIDALKVEKNFKEAQAEAPTDKKYWEDKIKTDRAELEALSDKDAAGKKGQNIKDRIKSSEIKLDAFSTNSRTNNRTEKTTPDENTITTPLTSVLERQALEQSRYVEDLWNEIWQTEINSLDEGSRKTLEQMELNHEKKLQAIDREKEDILQKKREEAEAAFNKQEDANASKNTNYVRKVFDDSLITLTDDENNQINDKYKLALAQQTNDINSYYKSILEKYQDFSAQRINIERQYNGDIDILKAHRTAKNSDETDRAIREAKKKKKEALQQIDDSEVRSLEGSNDFLKNLYGNYSQMEFEDLQNLIREAKQLQNYLSGKSSGDSLTLISKEQLLLIKETPGGLEKLRSALDKLLQEEKGNPWEKVFDTFSKGLAKLKASKDINDVSDAMKDIGGAAADAASMLGGTAGSLAKMFEDMGNVDAADTLTGVQDAMNAISNIGEGFAKGGIIGGIGAAVGEAANFIGKAFSANAHHKEVLREIMNEATAQQRAYNLLLLEQNLLYEKGNTIFGADSYSKAKNAIDNMKNSIVTLNDKLKGDGEYDGGLMSKYLRGALQKIGNYEGSSLALKDQYEGLANIQIKTGHKKTGLFGWGKGKDIYSSILSEYPQLIEQNGKFNASLAETIISTRTMSETDKAAFQELIDLSKHAEAALQEVKDYLSDIFGDLGNTMGDALVDAFKNGSDAARVFTDSVSEMLESLAKQMIYSVTLAPIVDKAQNSMLEVMKNTTLSDEEKFKQWTDILGTLVNDGLNQQEYSNLLYERFQKLAEEKGFSIFDNDDSSSQTSSQKGFAAMSQDTGDELNGRFTALQISNEEIKNSMLFVIGSLSSLCTTAFEGNIFLMEMRNLAIMSNGHLENIAKYTKTMMGFGEKLDNIDRNTQNI